MKRILIACEESQELCKAFRKLGFEAYSCDIQHCSGGHPEWHIQDDVLKHLNDGWDLMIAHPPCTHLSVSGARWFTEGKKSWSLQEEALEFVKKLMDAPIERICIENPISVISTKIRKPDQIIQPYMFGDNETKATCIWLKNLPRIHWTEFPEWEYYKCPYCKTEFEYKYGAYGCPGCGAEQGKAEPKWNSSVWNMPPSKDRGKLRSKTFQGMAKAISKQWADFINSGLSVRDWEEDNGFSSEYKLIDGIYWTTIGKQESLDKFL